jgi:hypothetical protein
LHPETRQTLIDNALRDFIPAHLTLHQFKVTNVIPRVKDRGIFVEFTYQSDPSRSHFALDDILHVIREHLGHEIEQGYSTSATVSGTYLPKFFRIRAYLVKVCFP